MGKRWMRRCLAALLCMAALGLSACGGRGPVGADAFTVRMICQSEDIYQIFYTCYIGGESRGIGGMADLEGGELTEESDLTLTFSKSYFEEGDDPANFSLDFSPYGKEDTAEIGTTAPLAITADWGETYTVVFSGDRQSGFHAALAE